MATSSKTATADRHHGGPGSSHQRPDRPDPTRKQGPAPDEPTNRQRSKTSGGGGERDLHHTHDPRKKGGRSKES